MNLEAQLRTILGRYTVRSHYITTRDAKAARYALFRDGKQVGEPMGHAEAKSVQESMTVADILAAFEGMQHG